VKTWQKILVPTLITLLIGGSYLLYVWHQRQNPGTVATNQPAEKLTDDDVAVVRTLSPQHFDDLQQLVGTRVWMKNGYAMPYFPFEKNTVEFEKKVGVIPASQPMDVKKVVKEVAPAKLDDSMEHGTRQAFVIFSIPGKDTLFATPVGSMDGSGPTAQESCYTDLLFYYDDPHAIYPHWRKEVWTAIDEHKVLPGMSELQTRMAIGQKMHPDGETEGDRTVTYDQDGKQWTITYVKDHATTIKGG
jgi:hypothetical protein